jgi:hypothetical protein
LTEEAQGEDTPLNRPLVKYSVIEFVDKMKKGTEKKLEVKPLDPERQRAYLHRYLGEGDGEKLFWQF